MHTEVAALKILQDLVPKFPPQVIILGSGWNEVIKNMTVEIEIPYSQLWDVKTTVPGHEGKLVIAKRGRKRVALMVGRFHMYEGFTAREATLPIRVLAQAGVTEVVLTAACGAINEKYQVGDFAVTSDLLTLFLALDNPLVGPQFQDMSEVFDVELRRKAMKVALKHGLSVHEGVYAYYHGPNFETPADKMALRFLGADVVGMSTAPESIMARWCGMKVLSLAFVTNLAFVKHNHKEVLAEAKKASSKMVDLLEGIIE